MAKELAPINSVGTSGKKAPGKFRKGISNLGSKIVKGLREIKSELKKVSWPGFSKVMKQAGVVFAVVIAFLILIGAVDALLAYLLKLVVSAGA